MLSQAEYASISKYKAKKQIFRLCSLSKRYYHDDISRVLKYFPSSFSNPIPKPKNFTKEGEPVSKDDAFWKGFYSSKARNSGEKIEDAVKSYINYQSPGSAFISKDTAGKDLNIDGVVVEVKSSKNQTPQYLLNSSSFEPDDNKAYVFVLNSETDVANVLVVSSMLLYNVVLHNIVGDNKDYRSAVYKSVEQALERFNLTEVIAETIISGNPKIELPKALNISNSPLTPRIRIMFQMNKI
jgi:hypothetical protein